MFLYLKLWNYASLNETIVSTCGSRRVRGVTKYSNDAAWSWSFVLLLFSALTSQDLCCEKGRGYYLAATLEQKSDFVTLF